MHYIDTSFLAPLFFAEDKSVYVQKVLSKIKNNRLISRWLCVEFAGIISRKVRMTALKKSDSERILSLFENLVNESFVIISPTTADFNQAMLLLNQGTELGLRTGDALHIAIAQNHDIQTFYTLDQKLAQCVEALTNLAIVT